MFRRSLKKTHKAARAARRVCLVGLLLHIPIEIGKSGRQAPVTLCQAQKTSNRNLHAVRQREPHIPHVRFTDGDGLAQLAHAARFFRAEQVAHAGMPAHEFAGRGLLEALGSAAVRLQLHFLVLLHNFLFRSFAYAGPPAEVYAGRLGAAEVAPFLGASNASKIFASMRGPNSTCAWSVMSMSRRFILARPTSWCAISRPR
jgi:hypothetical protein